MLSAKEKAATFALRMMLRSLREFGLSHEAADTMLHHVDVLVSGIERRHVAWSDALQFECAGCGLGWEACNPRLWAQQKKCCPDCDHANSEKAEGLIAIAMLAAMALQRGGELRLSSEVVNSAGNASVRVAFDPFSCEAVCQAAQVSRGPTNGH